MSPILVRPVREQLEHDRLIRLLQAKLRRKFDAGINPGAEQNVPVGSGPTAVYPDLVLSSLDRGHRLWGLSRWKPANRSTTSRRWRSGCTSRKLRTAFHLYVPATMVDVARRLCEDNHVNANEIWSYHSLGDQVRFTLVHRSREVAPVRPRPPAAERPARPGRAKKAKPAKAPRPPSPSNPLNPSRKPPRPNRPRSPPKPAKRVNRAGRRRRR